MERDGNLSAIELTAIDAGAEDVRASEEGLEVYTKPLDLQKLKKLFHQKAQKIARADIIKESSQGVNLTDEQNQKLTLYLLN